MERSKLRTSRVPCGIRIIWTEIVHDAMHSGHQLHNIEVDQKADLQFEQPQMRQCLSSVDRMDLILRLALDEDSIIDEQIRLEAAFDAHLFVLNGNRLLMADFQSDFREFVTKASLIG